MEGHGQVIFAYGSNGTARGYRDRDDKISSLSESLLHIDLYGKLLQCPPFCSIFKRYLNVGQFIALFQSLADLI